MKIMSRRSARIQEKNSRTLGTEGRICANCQDSEPPQWRSGSNGEVLCNACGIFRSRYGKNRPSDLYQRCKRKKKGEEKQSKRQRTKGAGDADPRKCGICHTAYQCTLVFKICTCKLILAFLSRPTISILYCFQYYKGSFYCKVIFE